jgi:structural maintenance of chromosome 1
VINFFFFWVRLDDVEAKLIETEKEAEKARKDSRTARDQFNDVKQKRYVLLSRASSSGLSEL